MIAKFCDCAHFLWIFLIFRTKVPVDASKERERERERHTHTDTYGRHCAYECER